MHIGIMYCCERVCGECGDVCDESVGIGSSVVSGFGKTTEQHKRLTTIYSIFQKSFNSSGSIGKGKFWFTKCISKG
jgi:hypothetical protein